MDGGLGAILQQGWPHFDLSLQICLHQRVVFIAVSFFSGEPLIGASGLTREAFGTAPVREVADGLSTLRGLL